MTVSAEEEERRPRAEAIAISTIVSRLMIDLRLMIDTRLMIALPSTIALRSAADVGVGSDVLEAGSEAYGTIARGHARTDEKMP